VQLWGLEITLETQELFILTPSVLKPSIKGDFKKFHFKQTYKSLLFLIGNMDICFWLAEPSKPSSQPVGLKT